MAGGYTIGVASETGPFERGIRSGVIDPLEDAEDVIKDLGRASDKAGDQLEDSLREAQQESDKARREIDDLADAVVAAGRKSRDIEDGVRKGTDGASEAVGEFKDEAISNLSETVSSFRGDAEDIAQIAQDTLGGVVANLGPAGMAAGVAGAAGIGLIMGAIEEAKEEEAEFREQVAELADVLIETGGEGEEAIAAIAEKLKELAAPTDEGSTSLAKLRDQAKNTESGFRKLAQAYAGNVEGLEEIIAKEREALDAMDNRANRRSKSRREEIGDRREIVAALEEQKSVVEEAQKAEEAWIAAGGPALEARAEAMSALQGELDDAVGAWGDYVNAETNATDPAGYIAAMQARMESTSNFNNNVRSIAEEFNLSHEATQAILDQGIEFAPMLQSIIDAGLGEEYAAQIEAMLAGGQAIVDDTPIDAKVTAQADTESAKGALDETATDRESTVTAQPETRAAARQLDGVADKKRTATITAKASTAEAQRALTNAARARTAHITAAASTWAAQAALDRLTKPRTVQITADVRDREGRPIP